MAARKRSEEAEASSVTALMRPLQWAGMPQVKALAVILLAVAATCYAWQ